MVGSEQAHTPGANLKKFVPSPSFDLILQVLGITEDCVRNSFLNIHPDNTGFFLLFRTLCGRKHAKKKLKGWGISGAQQHDREWGLSNYNTY